eukprot:7417264-Alexandrium_andersonii.AAC.1
MGKRGGAQGLIPRSFLCTSLGQLGVWNSPSEVRQVRQGPHGLFGLGHWQRSCQLDLSKVTFAATCWRSALPSKCAK